MAERAKRGAGDLQVSIGYPVGQSIENKGELRCICHRLLCKIKDNVIEIKCAKCKRLIYIHTSEISKIEYL